MKVGLMRLIRPIGPIGRIGPICCRAHSAAIHVTAAIPLASKLITDYYYYCAPA
jgi:hypothetical protein